MPEADRLTSKDGYVQGDMDIHAAEILLSQEGLLPVVAFHIQQSVEKYIKGFLLSRGWMLRRIHDVEILIQEAIAKDADFAPFLTPCQRITEYYIETRYPIGSQSELKTDMVQGYLETARSLRAMIRKKS